MVGEDSFVCGMFSRGEWEVEKGMQKGNEKKKEKRNNIIKIKGKLNLNEN